MTSTDTYLHKGTPAYRSASIALFCCGFATFALLYTVQPLLPLFSKAFSVDAATASWAVSTATIGVAVSLHLAGMYVTSPLAGWLSDRFGRLLIIGAGAVILILAVMLAGLAPGSDRLLVILALFLNGVGWNMAFVAGSALLTDALAPNERASVQGLADLFMGLMGALGSATGGMILGIWGFAILNAVGAVLVLGPLTVTLLRRPALSPREG